MSSRNNKSYIPRRAILAGIGASAASMFVRPMFASAADAVKPRILIVHRPCGTRKESFFPSAGGLKDFVLPSITQSFEPLRKEMVILQGIACPRDNNWIGDKHSAGMITMMSGRRFIGIPGTDSIVGDKADGNAKNIVAADKTFDQLLLEKSPLLQNSKLASIQATALRNSSVGLPAFRVMSYNKANGPLFPESRPGVLFDSIFGTGVGLSADALARLRGQNKNILDFVNADLTRLRSHVPSSQLPKLDAHLAAIQELQAAVGTSGVALGAACSKPTQVSLPGITADLTIDEAQHLAVAKNQLAIISASFQCDLTRVATFSFAHGNSTLEWKKMSPGFPDFNGGHHDISHQTNATAAQARIEQIYCEQLAAFLQTMKAIPEGSGTMLDNTLVVFFNEVSNGNDHGTDNIPLLMFGGKSLGLQTGQHLHFTNRYMNDVWAAIGSAFGPEMKTFGDTQYSTGPVPGLFA